MFHKHTEPTSRRDLLRSVPLFDGVPDEVLDRLGAHLEDVELPQGRRIVTEGTRAYELHIIVDGKAQVRVDGEVVGEVGPGEVIGELAVLRGTDRTATVSALTPIRLLSMPAGESAWLLTHPLVSERVREALSEHLRGPQSSR